MTDRGIDMEAEEAGPPPVKLATYGDYATAQAAVDTLSDEGFPVSSVSIVWSGLRRVEQVTGRRTILTAAFEGAFAGAWFAMLLGILSTLFVDTTGTSDVAVIFTYFVVGAIAGAVWYGARHALWRGQRDFSTEARLDAERYELWVRPDVFGLAAELLNVQTTRPQDPGPNTRVAET